MGLASVTLNPGADGAEVAVDTVSAKEYQLVKISHGALGTATSTTAATPLPVTNFLTEVGLGNVAGYAIVTKFGHNPDIDTGVFEAVWGGGGAYTGFDPSAAETVDVVSADANDTSAGTGARTIQIYGLDSAYDEQNETIILTGTTPKTSVNSYIRLNRAVVRTAGSGGENAGIITIDTNTTGDVMATVEVGYNQTMIAGYTVPNNKTGYLLTWYASLADKSNANIGARLKVRPLTEVFQTKEQSSTFGAGSSYWQRIYPGMKGPYAEKTDIFIEADSSAQNTGVSAGFDMLLVDD